MGFIWWALPSLLTDRGMDLAAVTALSSTLTLPWVFKFFMGPVVDFAVAKGFQLRHFIMVCQTIMGLTILSLLPIDWTDNFNLLVAALFLHGCFAATQDVGIDALAIKTIPDAELGRINGWMQAGMLGGRAIAAASVIALMAAELRTLALLLVTALIWLPMAALFIARPTVTATGTDEKKARLHWPGLLTGTVFLGLWIALTAGAGFEFFTISVGPLLKSLGGSDQNLSLLFGAAAPAGLALGALSGGYFAANRNARSATWLGIGLVGIAIILLAGLINSGFQMPPTSWLLLIMLVYLATGFLTAASYTLLMQLSRGKFAATRFALFMSATNGCEVWAGFLGGRLATHFGQATAMLLLLPLSLLAAPALLMLSRKQRNTD